MKIKLSDHFTYKRLLRFTLPSVVMMLFTSVYGVVDGFFVSNFAGKTAFTAVNFIYPVLMLLGAFGFMFGSGGSALIAKTLGEGNGEKANKIFSLLVYSSAAFGLALGIAGLFFIEPLAKRLGAEGELLSQSLKYARINLIALPFFMLQMEFQSLFVTAEKPHLGLLSTVCAGVTNMALDGLFVGVFRWGIVGAAWTTAISQTVGSVFPVLYFFFPNSSLLRLGKTRLDGKALFKTCTNGSSELMANIAMSLVSILYNAQLLKYAPENGIAAYGVLMYVGFSFNAVFIGYAVGSASIVGYHFGAKNYDELKSIRRKSFTIIAVCSVCMVALAEGMAVPVSKLFASYDKQLLALTQRAFFIYSFCFLFTGFAIYVSSFFTALNDGLTSAIISFLRTLVFQVAAVLLLPLVWGVDGIWASVIVSEFLAVAVSMLFLMLKRKKYRY